MIYVKVRSFINDEGKPDGGRKKREKYNSKIENKSPDFKVKLLKHMGTIILMF